MIPLKLNRGIDQIIWNNFYYDSFYVNIKNILEQNGIKTIIDIGASSGLSALYFLQLPTVEKIYCVEPDPESYGMLLSNLESVMRIIEPHNVGIYYGLSESKAIGIGDENPLGYSLEDIWKEHPLGDCTPREYPNKVFKLVELETIVDEPVDLIKMDCEGSEYNIIENSRVVYGARFLMIAFHNHPEGYIDTFIQKHLPTYKVHAFDGSQAHFEGLFEKA
jgi:FkbM family methyltransferase